MDDFHKDMKQLHGRGLTIHVEPCKLSSGSKAAALKYLMFLKMKQDCRVKCRVCTDGRSRRAYTQNDERSSPTVATKYLIISCVIDAMEQHAVDTMDIPGDFQQGNMDEIVYVKFEGIMAELLSNIYSKLYENYMVIDHGQNFLYAALTHPLYGNLRASLLFRRKITGVLAENG